ncbi:ArnT family glycosyltransferase [Halorientalis brevis]|uniref:ArnT family glycosyltransferase n=1 Tax=Halorientalis brevis TaxID=1126241 RepID=A0ABD6CAQ2_9EURY
MLRSLWAPVDRAKSQVLDDLRADPQLRYLLLFAAVLAGFWLWHRLPNFATRDERWRVLDPIQPVGFLLEDFRIESIRDGVTYWRSYGGTFYLYGLVFVPIVAFLIGTGDSSVLVEMGNYAIGDLWGDWQAVPGWVWTATVLAARVVNVLFAVGSVYVIYRLGTTVRDRATGRLAALLLSLTWGLLVLAHEAGEDVPALFFFLLAVYLAVEYVETGSRRTFFWGCLFGGFATGLKFNAGVSALVLGVAYLSHARQTDASWRETLVQPRFLVTGAAIGAVTIGLSYPQLLVFAPEYIGGRLSRGVASKGDPHGWLVQPSWWWLVRGYLNGLGLPFAVASVGGVLGSLAWARESSRVGDLSRLSLIALGVTLLVYSRWAYVRTHHLLLTFPLLALLVAVGSRRLQDRRPRVATVLVGLLLVSTGAYAIGGDLGYAAQGRDQATQWLDNHAPPNATIETYARDPQDAAVPHDRTVVKPPVPEELPALTSRCPDYVVLNYHRSLLFLAPESYGMRAGSLSDPTGKEYVRDLLDEDEYPYETAGKFGRRPRFLDGKPPRDPWWRLLRVGVQPRTIQYGDPQDMGVDQYTIVLERSGACEKSTSSGTSE